MTIKSTLSGMSLSTLIFAILGILALLAVWTVTMAWVTVVVLNWFGISFSIWQGFVTNFLIRALLLPVNTRQKNK